MSNTDGARTNITTTATVRRFIELAFEKYPERQFLTLADLDREVRNKTLPDGTHLYMPGCTIKLVMGATKLAMMTRLQDDPDPIEAKFPITMNFAIGCGQIVITANQVTLPASSVPKSFLAPFSARVAGYVRRRNAAPRLGEILDIDPALSAIKVILVRDHDRMVSFTISEDQKNWSEWYNSLLKGRTG